MINKWVLYITGMDQHIAYWDVKIPEEKIPDFLQPYIVQSRGGQISFVVEMKDARDVNDFIVRYLDENRGFKGTFAVSNWYLLSPKVPSEV